MICAAPPAQRVVAWDLLPEGSLEIMVWDAEEILIYKTYGAAPACHQSSEIAISQSGPGLKTGLTLFCLTTNTLSSLRSQDPLH